ncbi:MAG: M61 family metallopeptidase [Bacteroidales bacterium]|nr:M61 family metallopeptidase [Bacteroidales bacterium]
MTRYKITHLHKAGLSSMLSVIGTIILVLLCTFSVNGQKEPISYTVTMENPNNHYFHVSLTYSGIKDESVELKLPVWTPGYYMIMDYPKNIVSFKVSDGKGRSLLWEKTAKNRWLVNTERSSIINVTYDVYAFRTSVAESFLDDGRAFISPTGVFMHPAGKKESPVSVTIVPYEKFTKISTGLDPVKGQQNTYHASDFDVLYDCPILAGNQEILEFETGGIPYTVAAENLGSIDRSKFIEDLRKIVNASASIIGEAPYKHYTFIIMNRGGGGLEHTNSMAVFSSPMSFNSPERYKGWLSFVAHEFFHLYNVKTIRPEALGPFDYDEENYTTMLWFSEGVTSYYENLILNRAGLFDRADVFDALKSSISNYENIPGHLFQSAAEASFDAWIYFLNRSENSRNITISYYDKGCAIGMLLDLKIRQESGNQRSLDDVMRTLYQDFYKKKNKGFTDKEFREVCEKAAGSPLPEIFDIYIPTVQEIDYSKYLGYAGLSIDMNPAEQPGAWLGINTREDGDNLMITYTEWNSPGYKVGLSPQDIIKEINGQKATAGLLNEILNNNKPGDKISFSVTHRDIINNIEVVAGTRTVRSFEIKPLPNPAPGQTAILDRWLK